MIHVLCLFCCLLLYDTETDENDDKKQRVFAKELEEWHEPTEFSKLDQEFGNLVNTKQAKVVSYDHEGRLSKITDNETILKLSDQDIVALWMEKCNARRFEFRRYLIREELLWKVNHGLNQTPPFANKEADANYQKPDISQLNHLLKMRGTDSQSYQQTEQPIQSTI